MMDSLSQQLVRQDLNLYRLTMICHKLMITSKLSSNDTSNEDEYRFPAAVLLVGLRAISDALVGRISWDSSVESASILKFQSVEKNDKPSQSSTMETNLEREILMIIRWFAMRWNIPVRNIGFQCSIMEPNFDRESQTIFIVAWNIPNHKTKPDEASKMIIISRYGRIQFSHRLDFRTKPD